jgi:Family of unknown function (DUF6283)
MLRPAPNPCGTCPYRRDVPSGVWDESEYAKLARYDGETWEQPHGLFQCHQQSAHDTQSRVCAGWVACHDVDELMALRLAQAFGSMDASELEATMNYSTSVPVFGSGADAAAHGMRDSLNPSAKAARAMDKIKHRRGDIRYRPQRRDER